MTVDDTVELNSAAQDAVDELKTVILRQFPGATFSVEPGPDDPTAIHLVTTVDIENTDEVMDLVMDRVLDFQVERGIPIHVLPLRPMHRILNALKMHEQRYPLRGVADIPDLSAIGAE